MFALSLASIPVGCVRSTIATLACAVAMTAVQTSHADTIDFPAYPDLDVVGAPATDWSAQFPPYPTFEVNFPTAVADAERTYWLCDELMQANALDLEMSVVCEKATETVKNDRFGGDFDAYAAWWREQRFAQADALQTP